MAPGAKSLSCNRPPPSSFTPDPLGPSTSQGVTVISNHRQTQDGVSRVAAVTVGHVRGGGGGCRGISEQDSFLKASLEQLFPWIRGDAERTLPGCMYSASLDLVSRCFPSLRLGYWPPSHSPVDTSHVVQIHSDPGRHPTASASHQQGPWAEPGWNVAGKYSRVHQSLNSDNMLFCDGLDGHGRCVDSSARKEVDRQWNSRRLRFSLPLSLSDLITNRKT